MDLQSSESSRPYDRFLARKYFSSLDGLRAISILAVIWYHVPVLRPIWRTGYLGVHLFFVISGFLITTLLLREKLREGTISLRDFYIRRTLRIFPAYYLTLVLFLVVCLVLPDLRREALPAYLHNLPSFATYTSNWFVYPWGPGRVVFVAAWSLATEEQFYLFWPWIVKYSSSWYVPVGVMSLLIVTNTAIKLLLGYQFFLSGYALPIIILNSVSTAICLGCLLAFLLHHPEGYRAAHSVFGQKWSAPLFFVLMLVVCCLPNNDILHTGHMLLVTGSLMLTVAACTIEEDHLLRPLLTNPVMRYIGMISYGLYLYHAFGLNVAEKLMPGLASVPALFYIVVVSVTMIMATLSYYLFEKRFLKLKARFGHTKRIVLRAPAEPVKS